MFTLSLKSKLIFSDFYLPEFKTWSSRVCGHCEGPRVIARAREDTYPTLEPICEHGHIVKEIPNTVEALREHVAHVHPHLLEGFDLGWAALPTQLKERWKLRPSPLVNKRQARKDYNVYHAWHSWVAFVFNEIHPKHWAKSLTDRTFHNRTSPNELAKKAAYPGELLGLPEEFDPLGPPAEKYPRHSRCCACIKPPTKEHVVSHSDDPEEDRLQNFSKELAERVMCRQVQISWENTYKELLGKLENDNVKTFSPSGMYGDHYYSKLGRKKDLRYGQRRRMRRLYREGYYSEDEFD
jgi:hypothetical protein